MPGGKGVGVEDGKGRINENRGKGDWGGGHRAVCRWCVMELYTRDVIVSTDVTPIDPIK